MVMNRDEEARDCRLLGSGKKGKSRFCVVALFDNRSLGCRRKNLLPVLGISFLLLLAAGCQRRATAPAVPAGANSNANAADTPPPAITPSEDKAGKPIEVVAVISPKIAEKPTSLDLGLARFRAGDFGEASQFFEEYAQTGGELEKIDMALFHLFLARRLSGSSGKNVHKPEEALRRIVSEFPKSSYREIAEFILGLQSQVENLRSDSKEKEAKIKQLSEELQKLKEIDMQRKPSSPLY